MVMMVMVLMMIMTMAMADGHGDLPSSWCLSAGSASFRMLAGLCLILAQHEYWQCFVSDAGWILLDCSTSLISTGSMLPGW